MMSSSYMNEQPASNTSLRLFYYSGIILLVFLVYGWTVFEPLAGDALMHAVDANRIKSGHDAWKRLLGIDLGLGGLDIFYRPVFNDFYISLLKYLFEVSPPCYRLTTLVIHCLSGLVIFKLFLRMRVSELAAFLGATSLVLSPALFYGIYEFGLSFSQLLVFFAASSLYCAIRYLQAQVPSRKVLHGSATLAFTFLTVFTKESAALWPFAVIAFVYFFQLSQTEAGNKAIASKGVIGETRSIFYKNFPLFLLLALVTVAYFAIRYWKFGSLTAVAAGIEGSVNPVESLTKLVGYMLFAVGIPTEVFAPYFSTPIFELTGFEIAGRLMLASFFAFCVFRIFGKNKAILAFSIVSALLTFLPIIKVTRNSPYYGDMMSISFAFLIAFGFTTIKFNGRKVFAPVLACVLVACLVVQAAYMSHRYIFDSRLWLARAQGFSRAAMTDFAALSAIPNTAKIVQIGNVGTSEIIWSLHHGTMGSSFFSNLGIPTSRFAYGMSGVSDYENVLFIDIRNDIGYRPVGTGIAPGLGRVDSAYFSGNLLRKAIKEENGSYDLHAEKVIRLRCDRAPSGVEMKALPIGFSLANGEMGRRMLEASFNLSKDPNDFIAEIVVPPNANALFIEDTNACVHPLVEGYRSYVPSIDDFKSAVSKDPSFQQPDFWTGKLTRASSGGVVVGPGTAAPNVLFQSVPVAPGRMYLIKAEVRLGDGTGQGRLQVNWHATDGSYLSSNSLVFQPTKESQVFHLFTKAPGNAAKAILYAAPHGDKDTVVYNSISLMQE